jgi:hypothetical protein
MSDLDTPNRDLTLLAPKFKAAVEAAIAACATKGLPVKLAFEPFGKGPGSAAKNEKWFKDVGAVFKANGCDWGGDWKKPDTPHMQWGACPASPTEAIKTLMKTKGMKAVWALLGAD